ncbi:MAG: Gfo/Idh/MocA family oxidoreductase [Verrucomicrobiota bacterium]|nr:Gfo/Idh/MocA family oxidoreductase [Verrucomicrobiota bacterium]
MTKNITRRNFTKAAAASSVFSLIPGKVIGANEKVNVAFIGCGAQGAGDAHNVNATKLVNPVALCDVAMGTRHTAGTENKFKGIPKFKDFRKMFDKMSKEIDAVTIGVPDHAHFPISMRAMAEGIHCYVEKPLAHTFQEIELMIAAEKKYKVSCQMGNQGHSGANYHQFKAWKEAGIIKDVKKITSYMNSGRRWHPWKFDDWQTGEKMPEGMDWDTWLATAPEHPFSKYLHPGNWRSWYDYGNGAFGDWGPHILDTAHRFLKLGLPDKITAVHREGVRNLIFPMGSTVQFDFPAREGEPPCEVRWYDGTKNKPAPPEELEEGRRLENNGKVIYGKDLTFKGTSHGSPLRIIPESKMKDMVSSLPKFGGGSNHFMNFVLGAKGEEKTRSPFHISGVLSQVFCLGVIAQRLGGELKFDLKTKRITNNKVADALIEGPPPRKGWEEYYKV